MGAMGDVAAAEAEADPDLEDAPVSPSPFSLEEPAIKLTSAYKHYGSRKKKTPVLLGLDMRVERGQIYGLLGERDHGHTFHLPPMDKL